VFDCPAVHREVSRNDRENDHGEESKESKEGEQGSKREEEEDKNGSGKQGCKEDGKEDGKEDRFQATSREEDQGCCQEDDSQEARRQEGSCEEDRPQESGGQEGCAHGGCSENGAQTTCCGYAGAEAGCPSAPEADGGCACSRPATRRAASSEAGRCVSSTRAEALRSAACAATSGFDHAAAFRAHVAFADARRRGSNGAAPGCSGGSSEPHGA